MAVLYGSQTYPWQMNLKKYHGCVPHFVEVLKKAGFTGIEAEICMLEDYYRDWEKLARLLDDNGVQFAALAFHEDWLLPRETEDERRRADEAIEFVSHFPASKLLLCHVAADPEREHELRAKQDHQIACLTDIARRAAEQGVVTAFHPNSAPNSIFRTTDDYEYLLEKIAPTPLGFGPDIGHMSNGNIDVMKLLRAHRARVVHVHFKDMDASHNWVTMGKGIIDFGEIVRFLSASGYRGWIMTEDESADAVEDSDGVVLADGAYMRAVREEYEVK